jgi:hypothetical protein
LPLRRVPSASAVIYTAASLHYSCDIQCMLPAPDGTGFFVGYRFFINRNRMGETVKIIHSVAVAVLAAQLVLHGTATSGAEVPPPWTATVDRLDHVHRTAENCVAQLKKLGNYTQRKDGERAYNSAKADSDAVIDYLIDANNWGKTPATLTDLQMKLESSVSAQDQFCDPVRKLVADTPGQKGPAIDMAKMAASEVKKMLEGLASLYSSDTASTRESIQHALKGAKWPTFSEVKDAP